MLKKILSNLVYFAVMLCLGFAIYHYFLRPNKELAHSTIENKTLSSAAFFAANLPNEDGVKQVLSQYKGKIIVLNFWATWCPPCREEMPELSELYKEYQQKNVVVLGVAIDEQKLVKEFVQATPVSYPLFAAEEEGMTLGSGLGNDKGVLPYTIIIDTQGNVIKTYFGRISKSLLETTLASLTTH